MASYACLELLFSRKRKGKPAYKLGVNPNLSERAPMVFDYVYEHKTRQDFFIAGDSGAGYVIPFGLTAACDYRENPPAIFEWAKYSKPYYERFDYDITGFIINGNETVTNEIMAAFNEISPKGSFHNSLARPITVYNGTPYLHLQNEVVGKARAHRGKHSRNVPLYDRVYGQIQLRRISHGLRFSRSDQGACRALYRLRQGAFSRI